ncbi:MAG: dethiobiotin synthase [Methylomonas sp.]
MTAGFFVTGTDTDVGKTWATIALLRCLQRQGLQVAGMKPVAAGCVWQDGQLKNADALLMQANASMDLDYAMINPYAFEPAVSPHLACGEVVVELPVLVDRFKQLQQLAELVVVEGAGGWYSPLSAEFDNADLAQALGLSVILVVGVRLGCINHARLTLKAIQQANLSCLGLVAVEIDPMMQAFEANLAYLQQQLDAPLLAVLPYIHTPDFEFLSQQFNQETLKKLI